MVNAVGTSRAGKGNKECHPEWEPVCLFKYSGWGRAHPEKATLSRCSNEGRKKDFKEPEI